MTKKHVEVWERCLKVIRDNIPYQSYKTWFEPIVPLKLEENILTIQVPSQFFYEWIEEHYINLLKKTIKKELGQSGRLEYSVIVDSAYMDQKPFSVNYPTTEKKATKNKPVSMPLNLGDKDPLIRLIISLKAIATGWRVLPGGLLPKTRERLLLTPC